MASFLSLPNELISGIASILYPGDLVAFATTSRRVHQCSKDALAIHGKRQRTWSHLSDIDGFTMVSFLRSFLVDHNCAWYLRSMKLWYLHGKICRGRSPHATGPTLSEDEIEMVRDVLLERFKLPAEHVDENMLRLEQGWDESLKVMAMAFAPNLESVGFYLYHPIEDVHSIGQTSRHWNDGLYHNAFNLLCSALHYRSAHGLSEGLFQGLRTVVVGTSITDVEGLQISSPNGKALLYLVHLPGIETIRVDMPDNAFRSFHNIPHGNIYLKTAISKSQYPITTAKSTCTQLSAHGRCGARFVEALLLSCQRLKRFEYPSSCDISQLLKTSNETLEEFHLCGERAHHSHFPYPDISQMIRANTDLDGRNGFRNLVKVSLPLGHLRRVLQVSQEEQETPNKLDYSGDLNFTDFKFREWWHSLKSILGPSMQTIREISITHHPNLVPWMTAGLFWISFEFLDSEPPRLEKMCLWRTYQDTVDSRQISRLDQACNDRGVFLHPIRSLRIPSAEKLKNCTMCKKRSQADFDVRDSFLNRERSQQFNEFIAGPMSR